MIIVELADKQINLNDLVFHKQKNLIILCSSAFLLLIHIIYNENNLTKTLKDILEGLIVYNTATLKDVNTASRNLKGLRVYLDSQFLFQLLGYEGEAQKVLSSETVDLLKKIGVQLLVFDKTVQEMQRILSFYERNISTAAGIKLISENVMGRYFLGKRNTSSDIRQFSALLFENLNRLGISNDRMPKHKVQFTLDEKKLGEILVDKTKGNIEEPRIIHDVDCAAAILTLRENNRARNLVDTKFVFATSSFQVVSNVQKWYREEGENGTSPFVHIRVLSNMAWLRKPELSTNLKIHELITLCQTVLQPSRKVWELFLMHLNKLERNHELTSDESVAIVVSNLTETMLGELDDDVDVSSIEEIIDRVRSTYKLEADEQIEKFKSESDLKITITETQAKQNIDNAQKRADKAGQRSEKILRRLDERALRITKNITLTIICLIYAIEVIILILSIFNQVTPVTVFSIILLLLTFVTSAISWFGDIDYVNQTKAKVENYLLPHVRRFIGVDNIPEQHISLFSSSEDDE